MRIFSNFVFIILIAAMLAIGWQIFKHGGSDDLRMSKASQVVEEIQHEVNLRMASEDSPLNEWGFPPSIDPQWFGESVPSNPLLDHERPWLEVATGRDTLRTDPAFPTAIDQTKAEFWYNPRRGIVRARVPQMVSDRKTLEVYNLINNSELDRLFPSSIEDEPQDVRVDSGGVGRGFDSRRN